MPSYIYIHHIPSLYIHIYIELYFTGIQVFYKGFPR